MEEMHEVPSIQPAQQPAPVIQERRISREPIFIRLDKFEESLRILKETKEKVAEIEKMLEDIKKIREEESKELEFWEKEMQAIKSRFEKIDNDLFSKIE